MIMSDTELLKEMNGKLDELLLWKAGHDKGHETIDRDIKEVREVLFDNPGLKSKVERLWNCKKDSFRWRDFWMSVLRTVVATIILGVIVWLLLLYKLLPALQ